MDSAREIAKLAACAGSISVRGRRAAVRIGVSVPTLYQGGAAAGVADPQRPGPQGQWKLVEVALAGTAPSAVDSMVVRVCGGRRSIEVPSGIEGDDLRSGTHGGKNGKTGQIRNGGGRRAFPRFPRLFHALVGSMCREL